MKLKSFYRVFRKVAPQYNWGSECQPQAIWAEPNSEDSIYEICPITAVYTSRTKESVPLSSAEKYGRKLGLSNNDIELIMFAADKDFKDLNRRTKIVRKALLRAIGRTV